LKRNNLDIIYDILHVAQSGARKTKIVYGANLNFHLATKYLSNLIDNGLIEVHKGSIIYKTTEKGLEFIRQYDGFRALVHGTSHQR